MDFEHYANCMHCGEALDKFALDETGDEICIDDEDGFEGIHDYDTEYPMGVPE